jgi:hypothetical protein
MLRCGWRGLGGIVLAGASWVAVGVYAEDKPAATPAAAVVSTNRAIVHVVEDIDATQSFEPNASVVRAMVDRGLCAMARTNVPSAAWRRFIRSSDVVGFRICTAPGPISGTRPAVVASLVESLLAAGHSPRQVVLWDKRASDMILAGYPKLAEKYGIRWAATEEVGWDPDRSYDNATVGRLLIGDLEYPRRDRVDAGRKSHVSKLLTRDVTKIVLVTPLLNHNHFGVNGQLANLSMGAVDNTLRFEHEPWRLSEAVPEICALDDLFPKLAFGVTDALLCQYRGEDRTLLHYAVALNQLRFSVDPVALDILSVYEIERARATNPSEGEKPLKTELYFNAALQELGVADTNRIQVVRLPKPGL